MQIERILPESLLDLLSNQGTLRRFPARALLMNEDDRSQVMYVIVSGRIKVFSMAAEGREVVYGTQGPGEIFGEMSLDGGPRSASVITLEPTVCQVIAGARMRRLLAEHPLLNQYLLTKLIAIAQRASRWMLRIRAEGTDLPTLIQRYQPAAREMRQNLAVWLPATAQAAWQQATDVLVTAGVEAELAQNLTALEFIFPALDLVDLAQSANTSLEQAARTYFAIDAELGLTEWRTQINRLPTDTLWQTQARGSARDDVYSIARQITLGQLSRGADGVQAWRTEHGQAVGRLQALLNTISTQGPDLAPVSVALRELRHLA